MNLKAWRKSKGWSQEDLAAKLGANQKTYSAYETGRNDISAEVQAKLRKLGYAGPWPQEEAQDAAAGGPAPYVTREEYGALDARLKAVEKSLEETRNALIGATGAIRLLATKAGLHEILELLK